MTPEAEAAKERIRKAYYSQQPPVEYMPNGKVRCMHIPTLREFERFNADIDLLSRTITEQDREIASLRYEVDARGGALAAQDERERNAAEKVGIGWFGCDTPDALADEIIELREDVAVRDRAMRDIGNECGVTFYEPCMEKMEVDDCSQCQIEGTHDCTEAVIAAALEAAKVMSNVVS